MYVLYLQQHSRFWLSVRPGQPKKVAGQPKTADAVVRLTTINFDVPAMKLNRSNDLVPFSQTKNVDGQPDIVTGCPWDNHLFSLNSNTDLQALRFYLIYGGVGSM